MLLQRSCSVRIVFICVEQCLLTFRSDGARLTSFLHLPVPAILMCKQFAGKQLLHHPIDFNTPKTKLSL